MTRTLRTSSYLRHMARHRDSHLPLLTPLRMLVQPWGTTTPHEKDNRSSHLQPGASIPRHSQTSSGNAAETGTISSSQVSPSLSPQHTAGQPAKRQEATSPSSPQPPELHATEQTTPIISKLSGMEIQLAPTKSVHTRSSSHTPEVSDQQPQGATLSPPAKSKRIEANKISGSLPVTKVTSNSPARASGADKTTRVTLRPLPQQQQETTAIAPTNSRHTSDLPGQESKVSAIASEAQRSPARQEMQQQHATIHIGTIDIHVVPPAPPVPLPPVRGVTARPRSTSTLSREMTSFIGLRQG